jgi:hypothetical protein
MIEVTNTSIGFMVCLVIIAILCYVIYADKYDDLERERAALQTNNEIISGQCEKITLVGKMKNSSLSGLIRGGITGFILGGPVYAIMSGATMGIVNPIMVCVDTVV